MGEREALFPLSTGVETRSSPHGLLSDNIRSRRMTLDPDDPITWGLEDNAASPRGEPIARPAATRPTV